MTIVTCGKTQDAKVAALEVHCNPLLIMKNMMALEKYFMIA